MKKNTTKRSLLASILALVMCVTMLVGTTFAWFTDSASTSVNRIEAGSLQVEIQGKDGKPVEELKWLDKEGKPIADQDAIRWEPNCTYNLTPFKIVNTGNLALKYKVVVTGLNGDSELLDVIHFSYKIGDKDFNLNEEGHLAAMGKEGDATGFITISAHMDADAGNKYMGKTLEGVKFTVYAAQDTVESDSKDNKYDEKAEYDVVLAEDATAFNDGTIFKNGYLQKNAQVILTKDVVLEKVGMTNSIILGEEDTTLLLDLNGHTLTLGQIYLPNAATVKISDSVGTGEIRFTSQKGIQVTAGASVVLNGGTLYASSTYKLYDFSTEKFGSLVFLTQPKASFVMNGGKLVADNNREGVADGSIAVRLYGSETEFIMNGGEIEKTVGTLAAIQASGDGTHDTKIEINGGSIKSNTVAIYHPQNGSLTVKGGYIEGTTAIYAKSGTLTFAGGMMHATAKIASPYQYNGNGCNATGDAVVIDACGYPGGNPSVTVTGGTYTVTAEGANGFAHYKYNGNSATIENKADGLTIAEKTI